MKLAYDIILNTITKGEFNPDFQFLDNDLSTMVKYNMQKLRITFYLKPLGKKLSNKTKQAIHMFKAHFITGLCSISPQFSLQYWYKLVDQSRIIFKMMCE